MAAPSFPDWLFACKRRSGTPKADFVDDARRAMKLGNPLPVNRPGESLGGYFDRLQAYMRPVSWNEPRKVLVSLIVDYLMGVPDHGLRCTEHCQMLPTTERRKYLRDIAKRSLILPR